MLQVYNSIKNNLKYQCILIIEINNYMCGISWDNVKQTVLAFSKSDYIDV